MPLTPRGCAARLQLTSLESSLISDHERVFEARFDYSGLRDGDFTAFAWLRGAVIRYQHDLAPLFDGTRRYAAEVSLLDPAVGTGEPPAETANWRLILHGSGTRADGQRSQCWALFGAGAEATDNPPERLVAINFDLAGHALPEECGEPEADSAGAFPAASCQHSERRAAATTRTADVSAQAGVARAATGDALPINKASRSR
ncbi:hypothetical protein ABH940_005587 [Streptacidiphilus sp. BW17]|uniref:hypothetical protein n=1 Tax=Streptacidiphilus sp. BW17 TaxID=3156274 RepID=UPI003519ADE9